MSKILPFWGGDKRRSINLATRLFQELAMIWISQLSYKIRNIVVGITVDVNSVCFKGEGGFETSNHQLVHLKPSSKAYL